MNASAHSRGRASLTFDPPEKKSNVDVGPRSDMRPTQFFVLLYAVTKARDEKCILVFICLDFEQRPEFAVKLVDFPPPPAHKTKCHDNQTQMVWVLSLSHTVTTRTMETIRDAVLSSSQQGQPLLAATARNAPSWMRASFIDSAHQRVKVEHLVSETGLRFNIPPVDQTK